MALTCEMFFLFRILSKQDRLKACRLDQTILYFVK
jgi:hypothetical protein